MTKTLYAIYDAHSKKFKARTSLGWTDIPTQTYETEGRATGALKTTDGGYRGYRDKKYLMIIPVTLTWPDSAEILEGMFK